MMAKFISGIAKAREIQAEYGLDSFPIDIERLCDSLGIRVERIDFTRLWSNKTEISSAFTKKNGQFYILLNGSYSNALSRFAVAHELGHYFLHPDVQAEKITVSFRGDGSYREIAANKFAAELLMPEKLLTEVYEKMVIPVSDTLARKFKVPKPEMCRQLDRLERMYI